MKQFLFILLLLSSINLTYAENWCDPSCNLIISFPEGGSINATEALTLTFSPNGVLNLGETGTINSAVQPADTVFSDGGVLSLSAGESIIFDHAGYLELGTEGNISTTYLNITTIGEVSIVATSSIETGSVSTQGKLSIISNGDNALMSFADTANITAEYISFILNGDNATIRPGADYYATSGNSLILGNGEFTTLEVTSSTTQLVEFVDNTPLNESNDVSAVLNSDSQISLINTDSFASINSAEIIVINDLQEIPDLSLISISSTASATNESQPPIVYPEESLSVTIGELSGERVLAPVNQVLLLSDVDLNGVNVNPVQELGVFTLNDLESEIVTTEEVQLIISDEGFVSKRIESTSYLNNEVRSSFTIELPVDNLLGFDGTQLVTSEGENCVVSENECVTDKGTHYVVSNGKLVKPESGGGSFASFNFLLFVVYVFLSVYRKNSEER